MAGYHGYSMSNNAVEAYANGEKPFSKWTKADILNVLKALHVSAEVLAAAKKCPAAALKKAALYKSSYHHTSIMYNATDFYEVDEDLTVYRIEQCAADMQREKAQEPKRPELHTVEYLVWSGTRKHPKATKHTEQCEIVGNWAMTSNGRKSITANGFRILD